MTVVGEDTSKDDRTLLELQNTDIGGRRCWLHVLKDISAGMAEELRREVTVNGQVADETNRAESS